MNGKLYFIAAGGLWWLNAAEMAPSLVIEIPSQAGLTLIASGLWALGDRLYFVGEDANHGREVWVSDGTLAGTTYLLDLIPGQGSSYPQPLLAQNASLYFSAVSGPMGYQIWIYNQRLGSIHSISDEEAEPFESVSLLKPFGNRFFFQACTRYDRCRLYATDGETARPLFQQSPEQAPAMPIPIGAVPALVGERLLFFGQDTDGVYDLWGTDGTEASTAILQNNSLPIPGDGTPYHETPGGMIYQGRLYFTNYDPSAGAELWQSDGTTAGTGLLKDIRPGSAGSHPIFMGGCGERLCFTANDGDHGKELWSTDGSLENTRLSVDLNPEAPQLASSSFSGDREVGVFHRQRWPGGEDYGARMARQSIPI